MLGQKGSHLGCGIGCSGVSFRSCCEHLIGVDLSPEMLDKAEERNCYDELVNGNIECVLRKHPIHGGRCKNATHGALAYTTFDLIFSISTFVYIQDLKNVFRDIRQILNERNGIFAFSMEIIIDETTNTNNNNEQQQETKKGYALQRCARYAHKRWYLEESAKACGFVTKEFQTTDQPLRKHGGADVYGVLVALAIES